jgi:hypothetical protein
VRRRRRSDDDEFRRTTRAEIFGEEPRYSALFGLTAAWYALPAVAYVIWLLVGGGGRLGTVAAQLASSLPWVVAALILSMAVAALLRWAMVGWRALTLSFAAAVIGAGSRPSPTRSLSDRPPPLPVPAELARSLDQVDQLADLGIVRRVARTGRKRRQIGQPYRARVRTVS